MKSAIVRPATVRGAIRVPGDKSVSQRVALLSALASGTSEIVGYLDGEDARSTLAAMERLGAEATFRGDRLFVTGVGGRLRAPAAPLDMGNSGTGTRLLAGLLAGAGVEATMVGDASLSSRPMGRIKAPLERMGASVALTGERGTLPMTIRGGDLRAIEYVLPMASAQVKSCVLLAGLYANGRTVVVEPRPTRDHTERLFAALGLPVEVDGANVAIEGFGTEGPRFAAREFRIPGDFSSAAFWIVAAAARPGAELTVEGVGLNPRRTALLDALRRMGAEIDVSTAEEADDPIGKIVVRGTRLRATTISGDEIPNLIDELPVLAVAGALAEGTTEIRDAAELRVKESDRIAEMVKNLRAFGVEAEEREDGMSVTGPAEPKTPAEPVDSRGDHRIAMSMAILNLFADAPLTISGIECVATSYPAFWSDLERLTRAG